MEIVCERINEVTVVRPVGRLDGSSSSDLQGKIKEVLDEGDRRLVMDFSSTEHISGACIRVLLTTLKSLQGLKGSLVLCSLSKDVRRSFDMSGLIRQFETAPSIEEAVWLLVQREARSRVSNRAAELLGTSEARDEPDEPEG